MTHKSVIHPSELWSAGSLAIWSFLAGFGVYVWIVMIGFALPVLSGWISTPRFFVPVVVSGICSPWLMLWFLQPQVRTKRRAWIVGAACGLGAVSPVSLLSIGNPDVRHWVGVAIATVACVLFYSLSCMLLLILYNKLRSPPPLQDGTLCPACGYSLIGNTSMICPECGRAFTYQELKVEDTRDHVPPSGDASE